MMRVTILGTGAYGLALSSVFLENDCHVTMWTKLEEERKLLDEKRCYEKVLPSYKISDKIVFTTDMKVALDKAQVIVIAIPVKFIADTVMEMGKFYKREQHICIASKGIEQGSCQFISNIVKKHIKTSKICVISGGTFAVDMVQKVPLGLTLATRNKRTNSIMKKTLQNKYLRLTSTSDILGVELYGAIKNVVAIACGIIDGIGYPESTKSMFFTKAISDIHHFICALGGAKETILTYAGIGDLLLTCTSLKSRNYTFGKMIGEKIDKKVIHQYIEETTVEGYYTLKSIYDLARIKKVKVMLVDVIYNIVYNDKDVSLIDAYLQS